MPNKNAEIFRHNFVSGESCTATRCPEDPQFVCQFDTAAGVRRSHLYCEHHARNLAHKHALTMPPRTIEDVRRMDLDQFELEALAELKNRIVAELAKKDGGLVSIVFDEVGPPEHRPYVTKLVPGTKFPLEREFFQLKKEIVDGSLLRIYGEFGVRPGSLLELRRGHCGAVWERCLVEKCGTFLVVGNNETKNDELLLAYIKGQKTAQQMLAKTHELR